MLGAAALLHNGVLPFYLKHGRVVISYHPEGMAVSPSSLTIYTTASSGGMEIPMIKPKEVFQIDGV